MPLDGSTTKIFNGGAAQVNVVIDAFGYFAPPPRAIRIVANPSTLAADGSGTSNLTVTVTTGSGVVYDDEVTLTTSSSVLGSCGIHSLPGNTNASGQVTSTYTASTTPGSCLITATEADGGTSGSIIITQTAATPVAPSQTDVAPVICAVVGEPGSIASVSPGLVVCCVNGPLARKCTAARRR